MPGGEHQDLVPAPVHFLHVRKTGGTAVKAALRAMGKRDDIVLHAHKIRLADVPEGHAVVFFIRDPIARFVSGFNCRLRKGLPRWDVPWNKKEREAFATFQSPNALAEALSASDRQTRKTAKTAMQTITHVKTPLTFWLDSLDYVRSRMESIAWIGHQESLVADFEMIKARFDVPADIVLPRDDMEAHRTPTSYETELSEVARANLETWYADDFALYEFLQKARRKIARRPFERPRCTRDRLAWQVNVTPKVRRRPRPPVKVFGIGFHKTGTTSLAQALKWLGYSVRGVMGINDRRIASTAWEKARRLIDEYDAFQDNPWPLLYKQIYAYRPDSKFILTVRSPESWLASVVDHFEEETTPMREWIYGVGTPVGNEKLFRERFERHNREVLEFFADKPGSLLVMDFSKGDGWEKLCPFLGTTRVPSRPFPHKNSKRVRAHRQAATSEAGLRTVPNG